MDADTKEIFEKFKDQTEEFIKSEAVKGPVPSFIVILVKDEKGIFSSSITPITEEMQTKDLIVEEVNKKLQEEGGELICTGLISEAYMTAVNAKDFKGMSVEEIWQEGNFKKEERKDILMMCFESEEEDDIRHYFMHINGKEREVGEPVDYCKIGMGMPRQSGRLSGIYKRLKKMQKENFSNF